MGSLDAKDKGCMPKQVLEGEEVRCEIKEN